MTKVGLVITLASPIRLTSCSPKITGCSSVKAAEELTHPWYAQIAPEKCACDLSMILAMSKSETNPGRLYLKCPKRSCKLFQWINESPQGLAYKLLQ